MGQKDMLVVAAHAADAFTRAGGAMALYRSRGYRVHVLALTDGVYGESGGYWQHHPDGTAAACAQLRQAEAQAAADTLGVTLECWGLPDYPLLLDEAAIRRLTGRVLDIRPEIVLTHALEDPTNVDHETAGREALRAVSSAAQLGARPHTPAHPFPNLYLFESTVPYAEFNRFVPDTYLVIDGVIEQKLEAIRCFACQPQLPDYYRHIARHRGFQAASFLKQPVTYAEGFRRYLPYVGTGFPLFERQA